MFAARNMMFSGVDPIAALVAEFVARTGATSTTGLYSLAEYVVAQSLWSNFVIYPMKSAQNVGSGSTVEPFGGLTTNDMTLVNSPTWGATGITMNYSTHYAHVNDFIDADTLTVFCRRSGAFPTSYGYLLSQWDFAGDERSWAIQTLTGLTRGQVLRSSDGTSSNFEAYATTDDYFATSDECYVAQWIDGGGRSMWKNKVLKSLALTLGSEQTSRDDSPSAMMINAAGVPGSPAAYVGGTYATAAFLRGTLTTAQREAITDLINAL